MLSRNFYHAEMRAFQDRFDGRRLADAICRHYVRRSFSPRETALISSAPFFFIATSWRDYVDCSMKSGLPGFVHIRGTNTIEYPEYDGNSMYRTLGNLSANPHCGLLFAQFGVEKERLRINGFARILNDPAAIARHTGAKVVVRIDCELFPNCSRYMPDVGEFAVSEDLPGQGDGPPAVPRWKCLDTVRDVLPKDDPHAAQIRTSP